MTTYLLCFDASAAVAVNHAVHTYIRDANHITTWWNHLPGVFIFNTDRPLAQVQNDFLPFFGGRHYLIIEVNPQAAGGWLPKQAWDWLNTRGYTQLPFGLLPSPKF